MQSLVIPKNNKYGRITVPAECRFFRSSQQDRDLRDVRRRVGLHAHTDARAPHARQK